MKRKEQHQKHTNIDIQSAAGDQPNSLDLRSAYLTFIRAYLRTQTVQGAEKELQEEVIND